MNAAALFVQPKEDSSINKCDHTELGKIILQLQTEFEPYKYTVYRSAAKIVKLQKYLFTSRISYKVLEKIIHQHYQQQHCESFQQHLMFPPFQLSLLIRDIYKISQKLGYIQGFELEKATSVLLNFFWNIFDPKRRHSVSLLEVKVTLILLCKFTSNFQDIIYEFYKIIHDPKTKNISKIQFENLVNIFAKILSYIGESNAYGTQNVGEIVEQCFLKCQNPMGLTEQQFENLWFSTKTRFLIFANLIITIKRIESSEKIIHNNACASCGMTKIIGIRFKCRKCKNLSLCMKCFTSGYTTSRHRTSHPVIEMFNEDLPPKKMTHLFAKLCNVFFTTPLNVSADAEEIKEFCNTNETNAPVETELVTSVANKNEQKQTGNEATVTHVQKNINGINNVEPSITGLTTTASNASAVSTRLQTIIDRILMHNFKIEQYLKIVPSAPPEQIQNFLRDHQQFLIEIIKEMRNFKLMQNSTVRSHLISSTPNQSGSLNRTILLDNSNISIPGHNLTHSINGVDVNRSFLEANKSDYSLSDVSVWFNQRKSLPTTLKKPTLGVVTESDDDHFDLNITALEFRDTEMTNFRILIQKVKEIVEDSYSDNTELAAATQNLENVLDNIIKDEEYQRRSLN